MQAALGFGKSRVVETTGRSRSCAVGRRRDVRGAAAGGDGSKTVSDAAALFQRATPTIDTEQPPGHAKPSRESAYAPRRER
ncbi:MAG: hypothetical protein MJE77_25980 [Proteobacteria bacterium]|nr:hypothetical protein [Pseudomonadota bacterium]